MFLVNIVDYDILIPNSRNRKVMNEGVCVGIDTPPPPVYMCYRMYHVFPVNTIQCWFNAGRGPSITTTLDRRLGFRYKYGSAL